MTAADHLGNQFSPYIKPERRHEVEAAMPPVYVGSSMNQAPVRRVPGPHAGGLQQPRGNVVGASKPAVSKLRAQQHVARAIMSSDVSAEDLKGIAAIQVGQALSPGVHAQYETTTRPDAPGKIRVRDRFKTGENIRATDTAGVPNTHAQRDKRQRDLVHEIGHHVDPDTHQKYIPQGRKEAFAENYADSHVGNTRTKAPSVYDDPSNEAMKYSAIYRDSRTQPKYTPAGD